MLLPHPYLSLLVLAFYLVMRLFCFFFNDTATTEIYTLSLHDALPISEDLRPEEPAGGPERVLAVVPLGDGRARREHARSEEHTSELQSLAYLVCRLLLEKKKRRRARIRGRLTVRLLSPLYSHLPVGL